VLLRLTGDLFALFVQQENNISTDTERRAGLSAKAELPVLFIVRRAFVPSCKLHICIHTYIHTYIHGLGDLCTYKNKRQRSVQLNDRVKTNGGTDEQTDTTDRNTIPATTVGYGQLKRDNDHSPPAITSRTSLRSASNKNRCRNTKQRNDVP